LCWCHTRICRLPIIKLILRFGIVYGLLTLPRQEYLLSLRLDLLRIFALDSLAHPKATSTTKPGNTIAFRRCERGFAYDQCERALFSDSLGAFIVYEVRQAEDTANDPCNVHQLPLGTRRRRRPWCLSVNGAIGWGRTWIGRRGGCRRNKSVRGWITRIDRC